MATLPGILAPDTHPVIVAPAVEPVKENDRADIQDRLGYTDPAVAADPVS